MSVTEIRDSEEARRYILQGLWMQRVVAVDGESMSLAVSWLMEIASADEPIPPSGFVADVGQLILGSDDIRRDTDGRRDLLPVKTIQAYEDFVLGKLYADSTFERGSTAVCRFDKNDQPRGLAWMVSRFAERANAGAVRCSPGVLRILQHLSGEELLAAASQSLEGEIHPLLQQHYDELVSGVRDLGEVLGHEDVFELEHGTCLIDFGQRLALRQVLRLAAEIERTISPQAPRESGRARHVVTRMREEDSYPVGGFTSISTRGTVESLLHSQLAYMEPRGAKSDLPFDMFDVKFLRNELLYYSRDENEFLRRRRRFVFALYADLQSIRIKDQAANYQRIVQVLAVLLTCVRRLTDWLGDESLHFEFCFVTKQGRSPLQDEQELIALLLREQIENGTVSVVSQPGIVMCDSLTEYSGGHLTHCLVVSTVEREIDVDNILVTHLTPTETPEVRFDRRTLQISEDDQLDWHTIANQLLQQLI